MKPKTRFFPEARFGGFTDLDATIKFYARVRSLLNDDSVVVDIGCGVGTYGRDTIPFRRDLRILKGRCRRVVGVDIDPAARSNPFVDDFRLIQDEWSWPLNDQEADLAVADWVLEHVQTPEVFFSEAYRILRQGGILCLRTSNLLHYQSITARIVPNSLHQSLLARVQPDRLKRDIFPTYHRCNTLGAIRRQLRDKQFHDQAVYAVEPEPAYLGFSALSYTLGVLLGHVIPPPCRSTILAFARK